MLATLSGQAQTSLGDYVAAYGINAGYDPFAGALDLSQSDPKRPIWLIHGTADEGVPYSYGEAFAEDLETEGWEVTFNTTQRAPHNWLWVRVQ
jgi:predicted esterase